MDHGPEEKRGEEKRGEERRGEERGGEERRGEQRSGEERSAEERRGVEGEQDEWLQATSNHHVIPLSSSFSKLLPYPSEVMKNKALPLH